jgi:hypothetical protein
MPRNVLEQMKQARALSYFADVVRSAEMFAGGSTTLIPRDLQARRIHQFVRLYDRAKLWESPPAPELGEALRLRALAVAETLEEQGARARGRSAAR